ncbi:MAG: ATP-binding protein [bacterium]
MKKQKSSVESLRRELTAYQLLGDLSILAASLPPRAFLELGLERIMSLMEINAGGIYIYNETEQTMKLEVAEGISSDIFNHCKEIPIESKYPNVLKEVFFTKRPVFVSNVATNPLTKKTCQILKKSSIISLICIPIFKHTEPLGAIIGFISEKRQFGYNDLDVFQKMIVPLTQALECSRLFGMATSEKRKLGTILHVMSDGVFTTDVNCKINFWNKTAEEITGMKAHQALGKDCYEAFLQYLVDQKGKKRFDQDRPCLRSMVSREIQQFEGFFPSEKQKKKIFLRLRISPYWQLHGKTSGVIVILEDATPQWEMGRLKDDWRAMLTHDLKTPLTSTFGMLRILSDSKNLDKKDKRLVSIGIQAYHQMLDLVNLYLDVEKLNAGKMTIQPQKVELKNLLEESIHYMEIQAHEKNITLTFNMKETCAVYADKSLIMRVMQNLLSNAVKSILRGGEIRVKVTREDTRVCISVIDTGIGIPQKDLPFIFDRFYQSASDKYGKTSSSGLGLTFCHQVISAHGERIWAESKVHKGSTFCFTLPKVES